MAATSSVGVSAADFCSAGADSTVGDSSSDETSSSAADGAAGKQKLGTNSIALTFNVENFEDKSPSFCCAILFGTDKFLYQKLIRVEKLGFRWKID